ncbi:hypothetical protein K502DRAFT_344531 [Neoconidiobolus thromboides FSU 785]|nr:hypothetical protein K502DRAFT_344531 [Neoconidiobolus thromboides FSU 785]
MASKLIRKAFIGTSLLGVGSLINKQAILNQGEKTKPSIYDDSVIELVYLEDKTSRLEHKIKEIRLETNEQIVGYKSFIQSYIDKIVHFEQKTEKFVHSLVPKNETLLPNSLYVGIATLYGSILARNRFFLLRLASPLAFGISFSYFLLPGTTQNIADRLVDFYKNNSTNLNFNEISSASSTTTEHSKSYTSPELDINNKNQNAPLEQTIQEVEAMYTTRGDPGVRPVLERKETSE